MILNGRRSLQLHKCRNLTLLVNPFSSTSVANVKPPKVNNFAVSYLINSLGLTTKLAESLSKKVNLQNKSNPDTVLSLLRTNGFTDPQISKIITTYPQLLTLDAEKSLTPKLQFLQSKGASTEILSQIPKIFGIKNDKAVITFYDFAKDVLVEESNTNQNVNVLRKLGMTPKSLSLLFTSYGSLPINGRGKFEESIKKVVEMGFDPTTTRFAQALHVLYRNNDKSLQEKVDFYKKLGLGLEDVWGIFKKWPASLAYSEKKIMRKFESLKKCELDEKDVLLVFKRVPQVIGYSDEKIDHCIETFTGLGFSKSELGRMVKCYPQTLSFSEETVKKKVEFVVKEMKWTVQAVVTNPMVLGYSLEKRTVPRCNVIKELMKKGLIGSEAPPPVWAVLPISDEGFLDKFVRKYDDKKKLVGELMDIFNGKETK